MSDPNMRFRVSVGLKNVLGNELITNDEVAIFELVKNSFDAQASRVDLYFAPDSIEVIDNGNGMTKQDIENNWLFVAFSNKKQNTPSGFRDVAASRTAYAGSKGIGRFSSDRLGSGLRLQTRAKSETDSPVHSVVVDWGKFEQKQTERFETIEVDYSEDGREFQLASDHSQLLHGTAITITKLRSQWDREQLLRLKSALSKLINPFGSDSDRFRIYFHATREVSRDRDEMTKRGESSDQEDSTYLVNGEVKNFILDVLRGKTTYIEAAMVRHEGQPTIESRLYDRGELIYHIRERNPYDMLQDVEIQCQLYFLNKSAKQTFARRMGVDVVRFGSVFLFRNDFRVYPVGEPGDDWFGMDKRKAQGYARFLGTREIMGRLDIVDQRDEFREASSRDAGVIETPQVVQLRTSFFMDHCLKRLELYVVPVTFPDKEDKNTEDLSRVKTDPGRARVIGAIAGLVGNKEVDLLEYNPNLISLIDERSEHFEESLKGLRRIATARQDFELLEKLDHADRRLKELAEMERLSRTQADEERSAKERATAELAEERRARKTAEDRYFSATADVAKTSEKLEEEKKRVLFLTSVSSVDQDTILSLHHQITIYGLNIRQEIENYLADPRTQTQSTGEVVNLLERISFMNSKILGISRFATKANFRLASEKITADLGDFVAQYINGIAREFFGATIAVSCTLSKGELVREFKPIDVSIVIDNLISNAKKARARNAHFQISYPGKNVLEVDFEDDGKGFAKTIDDLESVFAKGFTTTDGAGLGLFHVRLVLGELGGTIVASRKSNGTGARFTIRIAK